MEPLSRSFVCLQTAPVWRPCVIIHDNFPCARPLSSVPCKEIYNLFTLPCWEREVCVSSKATSHVVVDLVQGGALIPVCVSRRLFSWLLSPFSIIPALTLISRLVAAMPFCSSRSLLFWMSRGFSNRLFFSLCAAFLMSWNYIMCILLLLE